jgi:hypothetical protein
LGANINETEYRFRRLQDFILTRLDSMKNIRGEAAAAGNANPKLGIKLM